MSKRNTQQRRQTIITELDQRGKVSVYQLAKQFSLSEVTIRKDLAILETSSLLLRRYGGAISLPKESIEPKNKSLSKRKLAIAKQAALLINDHHRIIIDSGSTTSALVKALDDKKGLIVMTNSLSIAGELTALENEPVLLMTGGTWDPQSEAFQGQVAEQVLRSYDFDQLFIGADAIDIARGTTTYNELTGLSRVMAEVSKEVIVMVESDKIGRKIPNLELPWHCIHTLITDNGLSEEIINQLIKQDIKLIIAN